MSDSPLVSIIIPCYNAEKYVAEAIQSVIDQTYPNCEVIVIDDGSTDGSLEVIKSFGDKIRWETGPNRGGCAARNRGLSLAKGDFIQFLDADDRMDLNKIEAQISALANAPTGSIACCPWQYFDESGTKTPHIFSLCKSYPNGIDLLIDIWLQGGFFALMCWLLPAATTRNVGDWNEKLTCDQDGEYFARVLMQSSRVVYVDSTCCWYRTPQNTNVSRALSEKAFWSKAEAIRIVSGMLESKSDTTKSRAAIRRRWLGLAYFSSHYHEAWMNRALAEAERFPASNEWPDAVSGRWLRALGKILGTPEAIRLRRRIRQLAGFQACNQYIQS